MREEKKTCKATTIKLLYKPIMANKQRCKESKKTSTSAKRKRTLKTTVNTTNPPTPVTQPHLPNDIAMPIVIPRYIGTCILYKLEKN